MPNIWSKKAYVQVLGYEYILSKKAVNMFDQTDIAESIYEGVVEISYKILLGQIPITLVTSGIREENPPHHILTPRLVRALERAEKYV